MVRNILEKTGKLDEKIRALKELSADETAIMSRYKGQTTGEGTEEVLTAGEREDYSKHLEAWQTYEREISHLLKLKGDLLEQTRELTAADHVFLARYADRPHIDDFIGGLFTDFFEQRGDHLYDEDAAIRGGIARFHGTPVTVVGHRKGRNVEENVACNFGMPCPEGYRKALRIMKEAEKFGRPIITFIDTPGAYPGLEAEEHGQGEAIAKNLAEMSAFTVPVIAVVTGEGNSGGALALSVANRILMLENAVYSILSPEGFASILWKDAGRHEEACSLMHLTAADLLEAGVADRVVPEPKGGAQEDPAAVYEALDREIDSILKEYRHLAPEEIRRDRNEKFRRMGQVVA